MNSADQNWFSKIITETEKFNRSAASALTHAMKLTVKDELKNTFKIKKIRIFAKNMKV